MKNCFKDWSQSSSDTSDETSTIANAVKTEQKKGAGWGTQGADSLSEAVVA